MQNEWTKSALKAMRVYLDLNSKCLSYYAPSNGLAESSSEVEDRGGMAGTGGEAVCV